MKRTLYFVMALALVLGLSQCKKEQIEPQSESNDVHITLDLKKGGSNGSRVEVDPPHVTFEEGDQILVGYNNAYVGTLIHNGTRFEGNIDATVTGTQKLYFYFVGNKNKTGAAISVGDNTYTVDISDQMEELPVLSFSASNEDFVGEGSYTAVLQNQCALVKFTTASTTAPVHVGGLYTGAMIDFDNNSITNNGTTGFVALNSTSETEKWAVLLPQTGFEGAEAAIAHVGYTTTIPTIEADAFITGEDAVSISTLSNIVYLGWLTSDYTATDGQTLNGTLNGNYQVSIADGATVSLNGANININNNSKSGSLNCAGITCLGNATINLYGGSINHCSSNNYPGIQAGPQGKTLTIQGTGSLNVQGGSNAAGIGGGSGITCGNISLKGGAITACGGQYGAGIGSGQGGTCGNIEIVGGEITATGGEGAAGIGSGSGINTVCGNIYLYGGIINACGSDGAAGIGSGSGGTCGSIEIEGGTITAEGGDGAAGIGSGQNGHCGNVEIEGGSINATGGEGAVNIGSGEDGDCGTVTLHPINGLFSVSSTKQVRFSRGNLQSDGTFAVNQYDNDRSKQLFKSDKWQSQSPSSDWYVLSPGEWDYLCHRSNKVGFATVNNTPGLIILPDDYSGSVIQPYDFNNTTYTTDPYEDNIYSGDTWVAMENDGVVFLPVTGTLDSGQYWSSSDGSNSDYFFEFSCTGTGMIIGSNYSVSITFNNTPSKRQTCSVRLVKTEETN